jgi:hypothetical protein
MFKVRHPSLRRYLVIGSTALQHYFPQKYKGPKDLDVFTDGPQPEDSLNFCEDPFWHPSFESWIDPHYQGVATKDELYTIKLSHSYWDLRNGSWEKHIRDAAFLRLHGGLLIPHLHKMLYKVWAERYGEKRVDLQMDKTEFFDDAVKRIYDHDSIHRSVAYGKEPLYVTVLNGAESVNIDMTKIKRLSHAKTVALFREEIYTTALERWIIPSDYTCSPRLAYARALKKTITSLTKGWSARFIAENYSEFLVPDMNYVAHHLSKKHLLEKL